MAALSTILGTSIQGRIVITQSDFSLSDINDIVQRWIGRQSFWPRELKSAILTQNLQVIYLAHWVIQSSASGKWSASIGDDTKSREACPNCKGTGKIGENDICQSCDSDQNYTIEKTYTSWHSASGFVETFINGRVFENLADELKLRCGKRDLNALVSPLAQATVTVFQPKNTSELAGKALAEQAIREELEEHAGKSASNMGDHYKGLSIGDISIKNLDVHTWLYPIFTGEYNFNGEVRRVEIDGITGEVYAEAPSSVSNKRMVMLAFGMIMTIIIIVLVASAIS